MSAIMTPVDRDEHAILLAVQDDFNLCCEQWDKEHSKMKARPPKQANNYVKHARNLLPLLESVAELHPAAKAVVFSFRAVIEFQYDRIENDARVYNVFLTASDMMRGVLDIDILIRRENSREIIASNRHLQDRLRLITADIKECGNAIDTYHKESKLLKFLKAKDWRETVAGFNQTFMQHRAALTQALSLRTAVGVDDLHVKMDSLVNLIYAENEHERKFQRLIRQFKTENWIQDPDMLQKLYEIIRDDPMVDLELFDKGEKHGGHGGDKDARYAKLMNHMASLKEEAEADIKTLCARNKDVFMKKVDFQTAQIQEAICDSAAYIVGQLLGPYDRLKHDDLRVLWKEMNWLFCVDSRVFAMALYESYLDLFSTSVKASAEDGTISRHRDHWTLGYFLTYGEEICRAVDTDTSGYIRISEVNAFTDQMPKGWSLPEWCVYHALGWHYEQHIYQKRLLHLLDVFYEAQAFVTPWNRWSTQVPISDSLGFIHNLARGPRIRDYSALPDSLLELIRRKVESETEQYRGYFKTFRRHLDSEDTVKMIYKNRPLETYILQLSVFILEWCLDVAQICRTTTVDLRQWIQLDNTIDTVRLLTMRRIGDWEVTFRDKGQQINTKIDALYGGLYRICVLENVQKQADAPAQAVWSDIEIYSRLEDTSLLSDILWPSPHQGNPSDVLSFPTWETLHPEADPGVRPPIAWPESEEEGQMYADFSLEHYPAEAFPSFPVFCNNCRKDPLTNEPRYSCLDCDDFDFCQDCFRLPFESLDAATVTEANHLNSHSFLKHTLFTDGPYDKWVRALGKYAQKESFEYYYYSPSDGVWAVGHGGESDEDEDDSDSGDDEEGGGEGEGEGEDNTGGPPVAGWDIICDACQANARSGRYFMACLHPLCGELNLHLCQDCAEKNDFPGDPHSETDYRDGDLLDSNPQLEKSNEDDTLIGHEMEGKGGEDGDAGVKVEPPSDDEGEQDGSDADARSAASGTYTPVHEVEGERDEDGDADAKVEAPSDDEGGLDGANDDAKSAVSGTNPPEGVVSTDKETVATATNNHRWWHTMVVIPLLLHDHEHPDDGVAVKQATPQIEAPKENDRIAKLEERMEGMEKDISQIKELLLELLDRAK